MNRKAVLFNRNHRAELSDEALTAMILAWQTIHDLDQDGLMGPETLRSLQQHLNKTLKSRVYPLADLPDGRHPRITSTHWSENPDRDGVHGSRHDGLDLMYEWRDSDPDMAVGDGGAVSVNGRRRFWVPPAGYFPLARVVLAAEAGLVHQAESTKTGFRCWVHHDGGVRSGYFHLYELLVKDGDEVAAGTPLGIVGHNPSAYDAVHLHLELSPIERYVPMNPRPWLEEAAYTSA